MRIVIIPAYEPDETLIRVAKEAASTDSRVFVVDDGSGSEYFAIFNAVKEYATVISYEENHGKGYALKTAYRQVAELYPNEEYVVVTMDCDGQHSIKDAMNVCDMAKDNPGKLILGSRRQQKSSPLKSRFGNWMTKTIYRFKTGVNISDTQTGLRAFDSTLMDLMIEISGDRYEYEMNVLMELPTKGIGIREIPIETIYIDNNSGTHFNPIKDSISIYKEIFKYSIASFVSFLVDYCLYSVLIMLLGSGKLLVANVGARVVSATVNFSLNYKYVFNTDENPVRCAVKYMLLALAVIVCNSALLYLLVTVCGFNAYVSKIFVEITIYIVNWLIQHFFVFSNGGRDVSL